MRLTAAPLRYGAGVKGKVLASLAAGIPCVMSPVAAEGIDLPATLRCLVGGSAAEMASGILRLHADGAACRQAAEAGLLLMENGYAEAGVVTVLNAAIEGPNLPVPCEAGRVAV